MSEVEMTVDEPIEAGVVHRSLIVDQAGTEPVVKLMLNLVPGDRVFETGADVAFAVPGVSGGGSTPALRHYTIESVGRVPFEESIDITLYVRGHGAAESGGVASWLSTLAEGDTVPVFGPYPYPFYPPMGSRSNMIIIGAGCGMVPFRWLAHKVQARRLDWMGKVLMLEGDRTGLEHVYQNDPRRDADQYFDTATYRAFEALKTRYSATTPDRGESTVANMDALWRLMGQGSVFVYRAGYRSVAEAMDRAMAEHLRLAGRWDEAKAALQHSGHWLEHLYG